MSDAKAIAVQSPELSIKNRSAFEAMRTACAADPGRYHGDIAKRQIAWLLKDEGENGAWAYFDDAEGR